MTMRASTGEGQAAASRMPLDARSRCRSRDRSWGARARASWGSEASGSPSDGCSARSTPSRASSSSRTARASASASSRPCRTARPSRSAPARSRARRAGFPWRSRHCARATRTSSRSVTSRPSPSRIGSPCRKRGCSRTPRPLAVARTIATELAGGEGECSTARGIAGSRSAEAARPSRSATSTRSPIRRSRYAGRGLWHLRKVAFERYWIGSGLERALAFRALWLGAAMLRLPVRL